MKKKTYEVFKQNRIDNIVDQIQTMEMNLRCCGNCIQFRLTCNRNNQAKYLESMPFRRCDEWEFDWLRYNDRTIMLDNEE